MEDEFLILLPFGKFTDVKTCSHLVNNGQIFSGGAVISIDYFSFILSPPIDIFCPEVSISPNVSRLYEVCGALAEQI